MPRQQEIVTVEMAERGQSLITKTEDELREMGIPDPSALFRSYERLCAPDSRGNRASPEQFVDFVAFSINRGLNPFARQSWISSRGDYNASIDGLRAIADRTGRYAPGDTSYEFSGDGSAVISATVAVKKQTADGTWHVFAETAYFDEYGMEQRNNGSSWVKHQYQKMPKVMLAKCAEARALRRAFPDHLSGMYAPEEMARTESQEERQDELDNARRNADAAVAVGAKASTEAAVQDSGRTIGIAAVRNIMRMSEDRGISDDEVRAFVCDAVPEEQRSEWGDKPIAEWPAEIGIAIEKWLTPKPIKKKGSQGTADDPAYHENKAKAWWWTQVKGDLEADIAAAVWAKIVKSHYDNHGSSDPLERAKGLLDYVKTRIDIVTGDRLPVSE